MVRRSHGLERFQVELLIVLPCKRNALHDQLLTAAQTARISPDVEFLQLRSVSRIWADTGAAVNGARVIAQQAGCVCLA